MVLVQSVAIDLTQCATPLVINIVQENYTTLQLFIWKESSRYVDLPHLLN